MKTTATKTPRAPRKDAPRRELIDFIKGLTPEQVDKLLSRMDLLKKVAKMNDYQASYTNELTGKLFFDN